MFVRTKKSGKYEYLQIVHNERINGQVQQRVIATLGRLDVLQKTGQLDAMLTSCGRFAQYTAVLNAHRQGAVPPADTVKIGPALVFERLWQQMKIPQVIRHLLADRKFEFPVERAIFLTVLHRLFDPGSDRAAEYWRQNYAIDGATDLQLHHLYRAMAWLGEVLPDCQQEGATTPYSPRTIKDLIEENLFARRQDLFNSVEIAFFDTTSIYFEGEGDEIGERGHTKDHRPDCKQMVVGAVLDQDGRPLCCELWPGNTPDVKTLLPIVKRFERRFGIRDICIVADRGMISKNNLKHLQDSHPNIRYILGARMRKVKEIREQVLSDPTPFQEVYGPRQSRRDPSPLQVKEVQIENRRYIVCHNEEQAVKDRLDRQAIVAALQDQLQRGDKSLVGNKGYRKYLKTDPGPGFTIDQDKIQAEARYDGKWVLQTDLDDSPAKIALRYKELWTVEAIFRTLKSVLRTRPIYHKTVEAIRGHVFCSFLALVLLKELEMKMAEQDCPLHWERLRNDIDALEEIYVKNSGRPFVIRSRTQGDVGKALKAVRVALGPTMRFCDALAE